MRRPLALAVIALAGTALVFSVLGAVAGDFDLVLFPPGQDPQRQRWTASLQFTFLSVISPALLPVNPLGLIVTYIQADQAAAF